MGCSRCIKGIVIIEKQFRDFRDMVYKYAFICDCWEGIKRDENYPSIKDKDVVRYHK